MLLGKPKHPAAALDMLLVGIYKIDNSRAPFIFLSDNWLDLQARKKTYLFVSIVFLCILMPFETYLMFELLKPIV